MAIINASGGGAKPKILTTPDGVTDEITIEKASSGKVKPSSTLGNATADKVLVGSTFTSDGGFAMAGTSTLVTDYEQAQEELEEANETLQDAYFLKNSTLGQLPRSNAWTSGIYADGKYVIVGGDDTTYGSNAALCGTDDGGWKVVTMPKQVGWSYVTYGNG